MSRRLIERVCRKILNDDKFVLEVVSALENYNTLVAGEGHLPSIQQEKERYDDIAKRAARLRQAIRLVKGFDQSSIPILEGIIDEAEQSAEMVADFSFRAHGKNQAGYMLVRELIKIYKRHGLRRPPISDSGRFAELIQAGTDKSNRPISGYSIKNMVRDALCQNLR